MNQSVLSHHYLDSTTWFKRLPLVQKELLTQSLDLINDIDFYKKTFFDYSFVVMPAAKAYEGRVKDLLFELKLISEDQYKGTRFRVGKALNPEIARQHPEAHGCLYDDVGDICGEDTAQLLWQTWKECRNELFHYFLNTKQTITLSEARAKLLQIITAFNHVATVCPVKQSFKPGV